MGRRRPAEEGLAPAALGWPDRPTCRLPHSCARRAHVMAAGCFIWGAMATGFAFTGTVWTVGSREQGGMCRRR